MQTEKQRERLVELIKKSRNNGTAEYELCEECKLKLIKWLGDDNNERN